MTENQGDLRGLSVCMLVRNRFDHDSRVQREARALALHGAHVDVVAQATASSAPGRHSFEPGIDVLRVLGAPSDLFGAAWRMLERLRIAERDSDARIFEADDTEAARGGRPSSDGVRSGLRAVVLPVIRLLARILAKPVLVLSILRENRRIVAAASARPYDVVHSHDWNTLWVGALVARGHGAQLVYDSHELAAHRAMAGAGSRLWAHVVQRLRLSAASGLITVSESMRREMCRVYDPRQPFVVVRNTPDVDPIDQPSEDLKRRLGLATSTGLVMYVGGLQGGRDLEVLVDAMRHLPENHLVFMGPDQAGTRAMLERLTASLGLTDRVHFLDAVPSDEVQHWTSGADVGVAPLAKGPRNHDVALPNKFFQYVTAGVPVAVTDLPELARAVRELGVGVTYREGSPDDLARALRELMDDLQSFRSRALDVGRQLRWEVERDVLIDLYRRVRENRSTSQQ